MKRTNYSTLKKTSIQLTIYITLIIILISCSTKKNAFPNRLLHKTATKYNVLYNGNMAYDKNKKQIDDAYVDDYWNILPIEPLKIKEELALPSSPHSKPSKESKSSSTGFKRSEEKAVKAIQKHSMNIGSSEKNNQIDDAYLLLGKSRYYDQRFVPALETFKYMIKKYPESPLFNEVRIWEAKSLIRLGQEEDAIYKLEDYLTKNKELTEDITFDAYTAIAIAYNQLDSTQQVIDNLNKTLYHFKDKKEIKKELERARLNNISSPNHPDNPAYVKKSYVIRDLKSSKLKRKQKARNQFILGQLYQSQQKIDSANLVFDNIIETKNAPYRYRVHAQLERAKNYHKEKDNAKEMIDHLKKMVKNRDNRPFLDGIYYQMAKIQLANDQIDNAEENLKKSLLTPLAKDAQKSYAYEELGELNFDKANFENSSRYYDSVLNIATSKNNKRIKRIERKRKSLDEVIRLENMAKKNDSILTIVAMSDVDRKSYFKKHIDKLKKIEKERAIILANSKKNNKGSNFGNTKNNAAKGSKFYFYNSQIVGFGKQEFQKIWGKRELADNWRISNNISVDKNNNKDNNTANEEEESNPLLELDYYLNKIPTETTKIDSITLTRNKAYYNLGVIYKEQFKKYPLSTSKLENLLALRPSSKLILPSYYHLYKGYAHFDMVKSDYYKNKIISDFPESIYAKKINHPNLSSDELDENSIENKYKETYTLYTEEKYQKTLASCNNIITTSTENPLMAKFELLKAHAIAKLNGKEAYITQLNFVIANFPNTEEGIRAQEILSFLKGEAPKKENKKLPKKSVKKKNKKDKLPTNEEMLKRIKKRRSGPPGVPTIKSK